MTDRKIKVLIVDDSALVRKVLSVGLSSDPTIQIMGVASSADMAKTFMKKRMPDVITLDLEMAHMDGISFMRTYMSDTPVPTVVISSHTQRGQKVTMQAFEAGAVDVIGKPTISPTEGLGAMMQDIVRRVKSAAGARVKRIAASERPAFVQASVSATPKAPASCRASDWLIALGASTGGVQALTDILTALPAQCPPIVIVQHMPEGFTRSFASRVNAMSKITITEARDNEVLKCGHAYIAPGGTKHMILKRTLGDFVVNMVDGEPVCFSRPSVDVLFQSIAEIAHGKVTAGILTGMGRDGAEGLLEIKKTGGVTFGQSENSCVVFGMPYAAEKLGATQQMLDLGDIPQALLNSVGQITASGGKRFASPTKRNPLGAK